MIKTDDFKFKRFRFRQSEDVVASIGSGKKRSLSDEDSSDKGEPEKKAKTEEDGEEFSEK